MTAPDYEKQIEQAEEMRLDIIEIALRHLLSCPLCNSPVKHERWACMVGMDLALDLLNVEHLITYWLDRYSQRAFLTAVADNST